VRGVSVRWGLEWVVEGVGVEGIWGEWGVTDLLDTLSTTALALNNQ